jgi:GT2 family glycosyltransferase
MKLLIVIVNYRSASLTIDCLRSVQTELSRLTDGVKVVITDNKSPDDSIQQLQGAIAENHWSGWASVQPLEKNGGFAYGNNAAIAAALSGPDKPEFILLLNPDTIVRDGAISELLNFMQANPTVGIAGSRLEDPDGTPQRSAFRFHSIAGEFERGIRMGVFSKCLSSKMIAPPVPAQAGPCDWVAGASMIVRREVFESVGLMDEQYFMYFEEVDFCLAAARGGWPCWYLPSSRVVHLVGAVSQLSDNRKHRSRRPAYWFESRRRYFVKNHGWLYAAAADLAYLFAHATWRLRRFLQQKEDTDPPKLLTDSILHSVFVRKGAV